MIKTMIRENNYMDSIFLMNASRALMEIKGVRDALVVMGTDMNKTVLAEFGGLTDTAKKAGVNDLIISLDIEDESLIGTVEARLTQLMTRKAADAKPDEKTYPSLRQAVAAMPGANLAVISLPGQFAAAEAKAALDEGMSVFIFSDNVPVEEEIKLKQYAQQRELFVMGPGAGTAVLDNISVGLMSKVRGGHIGIAAASGSGLQEVAMLVHQYGYGISQAIGTGGRDLSQAVGGSTMLRAIRFLEQDDNTKVIVLISKPPHPETAQKMFDEVRRCKKPVVVFFLGGDSAQIEAAGAYAAKTLEEAARAAVRLLRGELAGDESFLTMAKQELVVIAAREKKKLRPEQGYLRGLFCGGTHSEEAVLLLQDFVPSLYSNLKFGKVAMLSDRRKSEKNTLVDMGDEEFTKGKPHPVMDPSILNERLMQEGTDPAVGVLLFDLLLGYAVHKDPVGTIEKTLREIRSYNEREGRYISMIASICGTDLDPQGFDNQKRRLEELGVIVLPSNGKAALLAGMIVS